MASAKIQKFIVVTVILIISFSFVGLAAPEVTSESAEIGEFPYPGDPWAWEMIGTQYAHQMDEYGDDVLVAVIDTGIDYNHPDLEDKMWEDIGYDFVNDEEDPMDEDGHGTHVAGIVASVAPEAELMALKVLEERGGDWIDLARAIEYAHNNGADIITMSLGAEGSPLGHLIELKINNAYDDGILLTAAAGNEDDDEEFYPAAYDSVMGISAVNSTKEKAFYSNYGDWIEIAAPGGGSDKQVYSTLLDESYGNKIGTSMATPFVTGVAALRMSAEPEENNVDVREALHDTAIDLSDEYYYGHGLVNAYKAAGGEVPTRPKDLTSNVINSAINLTWEEPWDEGLSPVDGYRVYKGESQGDMEVIAEIGPEQLGYEDTEIEEGATYYYSVTAFNEEGESFQSVMVERTVYEGPHFEIEITDYDEEVYEGEEITIEYEVENLGMEEGTQDINFTIDGVEKDRLEELTLDVEENYTDEFIWKTEQGDAGEYELVIASENSQDSVIVTISDDTIYYELTINIDGSGVVKVDGEEVEDGWSNVYEEGTEVNIEATAEEGWEFIEWNGTDQTGDEISITMDESREITAVFVEEDEEEEEIPGFTLTLLLLVIVIVLVIYIKKRL